MEWILKIGQCTVVLIKIKFLTPVSTDWNLYLTLELLSKVISAAKADSTSSSSDSIQGFFTGGAFIFPESSCFQREKTKR